MQTALEARHIVKQYPGVLAVNDVSFTVAEGACFGLLGPNGAGKTTTVEIIEGVTAATSGEIYYFGQPAGSKFREEGATVNGDVETVNGTIRIDDNAKIRDAETINGTLRVSSGVVAEDLSTVNGAIRIDKNVTISGHVEAVNGSIGVANGSTVARHHH